MISLILLCIWFVLNAGCRLVPPSNHADPDMYYMPERRGEGHRNSGLSGKAFNSNTYYQGIDEPYLRYSLPLDTSLATLTQTSPSCCLPQYMSSIPLSPGDRVRILILDGDLFNGDYEVNFDGSLQLPFLTPVPVVGMTIADVERHLEHAFVIQGFFLPGAVRVSVRHLLWGAAQVHVSGAVFQPGLHVINRRSPDDRAQHIAQAGGDYAPDRSLTSALQAAGGVRPDANLRQVTLIRGNRQWAMDLTAAITGDFVTDPPLAAGDRIVVPSTGMFQPDLVRPSMITLAGIQVHMSNLVSGHIC
ncbi:MAG: hypothetical protein ETSY1_35945 [Candidatus Entotheonella factor]|uniref:Polysaccharide export protein N-terminal domain-containing protein n=1 Tax=Entotheonella factor TaxID=1429438 RepID=W4L8Z6_ENTF1|nr:MAG: hypothetical protein ETSY1_35945 [Candidatus Entotheonella factor]